MKLPYMMETRFEADYTLIELIPWADSAIDQYGFISVVDVHNYISKICQCEITKELRYVDNCYGWTKGEFSARVYRICHWGYSTYGIEVSRPKLDKRYC